MPSCYELLLCLQQIVKIVNFVKTSGLDTRLFANLCADLGYNHKCLLFLYRGALAVMQKYDKKGFCTEE